MCYLITIILSSVLWTITLLLKPPHLPKKDLTTKQKIGMWLLLLVIIAIPFFNIVFGAVGVASMLNEMDKKR